MKNGPVRLVYLAGVAVLVITTAMLVASTPLQVSDNLDKIIAAREQPLAWTLRYYASGETLRPVSGMFVYLVSRVPTDHPGLLIQAVNAAQAATILLLFCLFLHPQTMLELALASISAMLFVGHLSFWETFVEGYPVNHFGLVVVCFLGVTHLTFRGHVSLASAGGMWLLLATALAAVELGVVVSAAVLAAYLVGRPGANRRVVAGTAAVLALYAGGRWLLLDLPAAGVGGHSSGLGFGYLSSEEIVTRFGHQPLVWLVHNAGVSLLSVGLSEPINGEWETTARLLSGELRVIDVARIAASLAAMIVVAAGCARVCAAWREGTTTLEERQVLLLFALVAVACAVLNYRYVKMVLMAPAAVCFAWSFYYSARALMAARSTRAVLAIGTLVGVVSLGASVAAADVPCNLWRSATQHRDDWAAVPGDTRYHTRDAGAAALAARLRTDALRGAMPNAALSTGWNVCWTRVRLRK